MSTRARNLACLLALAALLVPATASARNSSFEAFKLQGKALGKINGVLKGARTQLAELAALPSVTAQNTAACNADLAARGAGSQYTLLSAANLKGDLYCASSKISATNIADRAYFLQAIGLDGFSVGDFQVGRATGVNAVGLGYPSRGADGAINGIVLSPLSLTWFDSYVDSIRPRKAIDLLVVDDHGTVLARSGRIGTQNGVNLSATPLVRNMIEFGSLGGDGKFKIGGTKTYTSWAPVPLSHGQMQVALSIKR